MKPRSLIPQYNPNNLQIKTSSYINKDALIMYGWLQDGDSANIFASLRFIQHEKQCFSEWNKQEMKLFWTFLNQLHDYTWGKMFSQSRNDNKSGMGYTTIDKKKYGNSDFLKSIDPTVTFFELRVNQKIRVHCFRDKSICYIFLLDKHHNMVKN